MVLLDISTTMTGLRKDLGKEVVDSILATLGPDDAVTVLVFNNITKPLIACYTDESGEPGLVQV